MGKESNKLTGRAGEDIAAGLLESRGYRILERNYLSPAGEIDIIADRGSAITFVEVKTRSGYGYGRPCEAVDMRKKARIRRAAVYYLREKGGDMRYGRMSFDVVEVIVNHMKNVF